MLVTEYTEEGESARTANRPVFQRVTAWLEHAREQVRASPPDEFAALELPNAQDEQAQREATFLAQFQPPPGSDEGDWRRRAVEDDRRALGLEGEGEQASE